MSIFKLKRIAKPFFVVTMFFFTSACDPIKQGEKISLTEKSAFQCIKSQNMCEIKTKDSNYTVKFSQNNLSDNVKTELPFFIELSVNTPQSHLPIKRKVSAYLEGRDMFMGKIPVFFEYTKARNAYLAQSLLASCSEEQMVWRLWVTVENAEQLETFFVDFTSIRL